MGWLNIFGYRKEPRFIQLGDHLFIDHEHVDVIKPFFPTNEEEIRGVWLTCFELGEIFVPRSQIKRIENEEIQARCRLMDKFSVSELEREVARAEKEFQSATKGNGNASSGAEYREDNVALPDGTEPRNTGD